MKTEICFVIVVPIVPRITKSKSRVIKCEEKVDFRQHHATIVVGVKTQKCKIQTTYVYFI